MLLGYTSSDRLTDSFWPVAFLWVKGRTVTGRTSFRVWDNRIFWCTVTYRAVRPTVYRFRWHEYQLCSRLHRFLLDLLCIYPYHLVNPHQLLRTHVAWLFAYLPKRLALQPHYRVKRNHPSPGLSALHGVKSQAESNSLGYMCVSKADYQLLNGKSRC